MIDILEKIKSIDKFVEFDFEGLPFQFKSEENENLDWLLEQFETKEPNIKNEIGVHIIERNDVFTTLNYKQKIYSIYKNPILFEFIYEKGTVLKVYEANQLKRVLSRLKYFYSFSVNNTAIKGNINTIVELKNNNKINDNVIILVPLIFKIFRQYYIDYGLKEKRNSKDDIYFDIDKEILEPYFLYIEKQEIKNIVGPQNMEKFKLDKLNKKLTFILNEERKIFLKELDNYIGFDIQSEPMMIIGNDGIGKSLTLQLYSLLKIEGYKQLYFNLKLLEKCNVRDYVLIESMRGFISKDNSKISEDYKQYMKFIKLFQNKNIFYVKNFLKILNEILFYFYNTTYGKYVIILDQFNFENISSDDFLNFQKNIPDKEKFKLIICCSLNDDKNKSNMFSHYKNYNLDRYKYKTKIDKKFIKKTDYGIKVDKFEEEIKANIYKGTKVDNFYFILNGIKKHREEIEANKKNENITMNIDHNSEINEEDKDKEENKLIQIPIKYEEISDNKETAIVEIAGQQIDLLNFDFPIFSDEDEKTYCNEKLTIYYSKVTSTEKIVRETESEEVIECMSYFNFLPKYYYKFYLFKIIKYLEGENNISKIIDSFYEKEIYNIKNNITKFYAKLDLKPKTEFERQKNAEMNLYQNLLKLKRCISKTYENSIPFFKLYGYSLIFPFKYINILIDTERIDIKFNESLENYTFKLRYSFPLIEKVIDNMIEGYNNDDKIDINQLSGSAYGNALEIKIRENLDKFQEEIEIRKVWSLNIISDKVINNKLSEIKKNKYSSTRYQNLEDITGIIDIKLSNKKYFYFKPENQDNKYFDSIFLIKSANKDEYTIISLQITKNKERKNVKDKKEYSKFLINNIKIKFEKLYNIKITEIYFWYILSNETSENESLCKILNQYVIKYAFYDIKNKCFYKERNKFGIKSLSYFEDNEALIYPEKGVKNDNIIEAFTIEPYPSHIQLFENLVYDNYVNKDKKCFEALRYIFFFDNYGPKIENNSKNKIIETLKEYIPYSNKFLLMFLFAFDYLKFNDFRNNKCNNELIYLFKCRNKIYLLFQDNCFEINANNNTLIKCLPPKINYDYNIVRNVNYNKKEINFSEIEDIEKNEIIYLYKIYYLGETLLAK